MKYIVRDWLSDQIIKVFYSEEALDEWMNENAEYFSDGAFIEGIGKVIICIE